MTKVRLSKSFAKSYDKLPPVIQKKVEKSLALFQGNTQHPSLRVKQLKGKKRGLWSIRVDGFYRIVFVWSRDGKDRAAKLLEVGPHSLVEEKGSD